MTLSDYIIRLATDEDFKHLPAVEDAAGDVFAEIGYDDIAAMPSTPADEYPVIVKNGGWVLVAEATTKEIVGYCATEHSPDGLYIKELSVHKDHSKQGIGSTLLKQTIARATELNYPRTFLLTFKDVPFNAPYYRRFGFGSLEDLTPYPDIQKRAEAETETPLWKYGRVAMKKNLT
ncbi:GNAT family N-acetyltransferase [Sneathiella sp. P13V-1]|uniref:GNAT family N-acetyltransferase n=1 Tax=Sneathiella sp. P13V-1 TaxID=2697366 RepID=UPI00187BAF9D|nr:GNAT family N-acetyltransferase [Sneathiella sp. P13V-1]MBE7638378.1 GNAT family N-acetyltransferase [Sneathiella sp. P13V-1]